MAVKRMLRAIQGAVAACALMSVSALAQTDGSAISFYQEQGQLIRGSRGVTALGDQLFGDRVDLYTGALSFSQTDISLPGTAAWKSRCGGSTPRAASSSSGTSATGTWTCHASPATTPPATAGSAA